MADVIMIRDLGITLKVNLPNAKGETTEREATWMRNILGDIFEMAFGVTIWLVHIQDSIITPLSCTMCFTEQESKMLELGKSLGIYYNSNYSDLIETILKRRANEFYARQK